MKTTLKPCPCGRQIDNISIEPSNSGLKYAWVLGNCCGEWAIEFRNNGFALNSEETRQAAIKAWNGAPRNDRKNP